MKALMRGLLLSLAVCVLGCQPATPEQETAKADASEVDSHAGHNHGDHDLGPHGGHLLHLEPSGVHAEWTHDDKNNLITVYLDDFDANKISGAKFVAKIGQETQEFPLTADAGAWTISSSELMTHINMKEAAEVSFVVTDDQGSHSSKIEAHDEHHH